MKKFAVIKDKKGNVSWRDHTKDSYPECEILHTTDCAQECINICLLHLLSPDHEIIAAINDIKEEILEAAKELGIDTEDIDEYERALLWSKFDWISRLN